MMQMTNKLGKTNPRQQRNIVQQCADDKVDNSYDYYDRNLEHLESVIMADDDDNDDKFDNDNDQDLKHLESVLKAGRWRHKA